MVIKKKVLFNLTTDPRQPILGGGVSGAPRLNPHW